MTQQQKILLVSGGVLLVLLITGLIFFAWGKGGDANMTGVDARKMNTIKLATTYAGSGEFDRALNLIDGLLIDNPDDEDALALQRAILSMDRSGSNSVNDTEALIEIQRRFLEEQQRQNAILASSIQRSGADSSSKSAAETEAAAARRAAADAEEARKKAQEEELAKASREMQEIMRKVNNLVADGKARLASNDLSGASQLFNDAKKLIPPGESRFDAQKLAEMADAYYDYSSRNSNSSSGREALNIASQTANEAIAKDSSQALPHYVVGRIARDANQNDKAITEFREAARLDTSNSMYFHDLGRVLFIAKRYTEARDNFQSATKINPGYEPAWYNLGGTLRALNRQDDALAAYKQAVAIKADYSAAHREIGRILLAKGDARGAVASFTSALQSNPNDFGTLCELAAAHGQAHNYAEAETLFTRALQINASDPQTNYNMAVVKLELKKNNDALNYAKLAVDSSPSNAVYVYTLGLACEAMGAFDQAVAAYKKAASLDIKYIRPRINLGSIYIANGNYTDAVSYLNEALTSDPNNFEVNNNLGAVYAKQENWSSSIVHYERALNVKQNDPVVRLNLARAYTGAGDLQKAQGSYQAVLRLTPDNWDAMYELGMTCITLGQNADAKRYLQDLVSRNPNYSGKAEAEKILRSL
jgi:tetratricopeptide (TPR) repeat protein